MSCGEVTTEPRSSRFSPTWELLFTRTMMQRHKRLMNHGGGARDFGLVTSRLLTENVFLLLFAFDPLMGGNFNPAQVGCGRFLFRTLSWNTSGLPFARTGKVATDERPSRDGRDLYKKLIDVKPCSMLCVFFCVFSPTFTFPGCVSPS